MNSSNTSTAIEAILAASEASTQEIQQNATNWLSRFLEDESSWPVWRELLSHQIDLSMVQECLSLGFGELRSESTAQTATKSTNPLLRGERTGAEDSRVLTYSLLTTFLSMRRDTLATVDQGQLKDDLLHLSCRCVYENAFHFRLCMCIAAIAVRSINSEWTNFWQDMVDLFQHGLPSASALPPSDSTGSPPRLRKPMSVYLYSAQLTALNIVGCLPSEMEKCVFSGDRTSAVHAALTASAPEVLNLVQQALEIPEDMQGSPKGQSGRSGSAPPVILSSSSSSGQLFSSGSVPRNGGWNRPAASNISTKTLKKAALSALYSWVASDIGSTPTSGPGATLRNMLQSNSDLLTLLFDALKTPVLCSETADILLAVFTRRAAAEPTSLMQSSSNLSSAFTPASRLTQTSIQQQNPNLISFVFSRLLGLVDVYRAAIASLSTESDPNSRSSTDMDATFKQCRAIVLLFVGVGETNISLISSSLHEPLVHDFLETVLEMTENPHLDIAELGMQFWNALEYNICGNPDFAPIYERLLRITLYQCSHPSSSDAAYLLGAESEELDPDQMYHFGIFRESAIQTFRACYSVMSDQCMSVLQEVLNQAVPNGVYDENQWRLLELVYFATSTVNLHVPSKDAPLISNLLQFAFSLPVDLSQQSWTSSTKHRSSLGGEDDMSGRDKWTSDNFASSHLDDSHMGLLLPPSRLSGSGHGLSPSSSSYTLSGNTSPAASTYAGQASSHELQLPPLLLISVARFIGEYRFWITQQEDPMQLLEPALCTCLHWAASPNSELAFAAAVAFKDLCVSSASLLVPYLSNILDNYIEHYASFRSEDKVTLTAGFVAIIRNASENPELVSAALQCMWAPCVTHLRNLVDIELLQRSQKEIASLAGAMSAEIEALAAVFSLAHPMPSTAPLLPRDETYGSSPGSSLGSHHGAGHPLVSALTSQDSAAALWSLLDTIGQVWVSAPSTSTSDAVLERLCFLYTNLLESCQEDLEPLLPALVERTAFVFQKRLLPGCLSTLSLAIRYFGKQSDYLMSFSKLLFDISQTVYHQEEKAQDDDGALLCGYFELCSTCLDVNPGILVTSNGVELISALVNICLQAVSSADPQVAIAALQVFDRLLFGRHTQELEAWGQFVANTVDEMGGTILNTLIRSLVSTTHHKARQLLTVVLHRLIQGFTPYARQALSVILSQEGFGGFLVTPDERERVISIFVNLGSSLLFRQFLTDFTEVVNHRAGLDVFNTYEHQLNQPANPRGHSHNHRNHLSRSTPHVL